MKHLAILLFIGIAASAAIAGESRTPEQLVTQYTNACAKGQLDQAFALFYQNGTPDFIVEFTKSDLQNDITNRVIVSAVIRDIPKEKKDKWVKGYPYQGKTLVPNLEPLKEMEVEFKGTDGKETDVDASQIMIGKVGKAHYFILSKVKETE